MEDCGALTSRWLFSKEQLENSPSRKCGLKAQKEFSYRQQAAFLIQNMGQRLHVSQVTINTAIVYMHRFYMLQSFTNCHKNDLSPAALFLAAKVEEQPRALEDVVKVCHACLEPDSPPLDTSSQAYKDKADNLISLETILLQTLGFEVTVEHPHLSFYKIAPPLTQCKAFKKIFYHLATNSLLTTFCLQYKPPVIACVCFHLACKWTKKEICLANDGKLWWEDVDQTLTPQLLDELANHFSEVLQNTPQRLIKTAKRPDIKDLNAGIVDNLTPTNRDELAVLDTMRSIHTIRNPASSKPSESDKPSSACDTEKIPRRRSRSREVSPTPSKLPKTED